MPSDLESVMFSKLCLAIDSRLELKTCRSIPGLKLRDGIIKLITSERIHFSEARLEGGGRRVLWRSALPLSTHSAAELPQVHKQIVVRLNRLTASPPTLGLFFSLQLKTWLGFG